MKFLIHIRNLLWLFWSNIHYRHTKGVDLHSTAIDEEDKVETLDDIYHLASKLNRHFDYKDDGVELLWDAIIPPSEAYKQYKNGLLKDDCDGFHSLVYHCLKQSGFTVYELCAQTKREGHCVAIFLYRGLWYVIDYTSVWGSYSRLEPSIEEFNTYFSRNYVNGDKVVNNEVLDYDYEKGKWKALNLKKLFKEI